MKEPLGNLGPTSTLGSLVEHYEWMLKAGRLKVGDAGYKRYLELKQKRWEQWRERRKRYGKAYDKKEPPK
tara:strand:- start:274 stop:483 length:210 start_codon:yes stop_codon:yes gene_type:complete